MPKITANNKIRLPDGSLASGTLYLRPSKEFSHGDTYVPPVTIAKPFRNGKFDSDLVLQPTPPGVYYETYWDFAGQIGGSIATKWEIPDVDILDISEKRSPEEREKKRRKERETVEKVEVVANEIKQEAPKDSEREKVESVRKRIKEALGRVQP